MSLQRQTALTGFAYGLSAMLCFFILVLTRQDARYLDQAFAGSAPPAFQFSSPLEYVLGMVLLTFVTTMPYTMTAIFWRMFRNLLLRDEHGILRTISDVALQMMVGVAVLVSTMASVAQLYSMSDSIRATLVMVAVMSAFVYGLALHLNILTIMVAVLQQRLLPATLCHVLIAFHCGLLIATFFTVIPGYTFLLGGLTIAVSATEGMIFSLYCWFVPLARPVKIPPFDGRTA